MSNGSRHTSPKKGTTKLSRQTLPSQPRVKLAFDSTLPPSDVETTNWNAVKMLASQYGITLKSRDQVQTTSDSCGPANMISESDDLGVGTPFSITATRSENGRFIYRFKWRGCNPDNNHSPSSTDQSVSGFVPATNSSAGDNLTGHLAASSNFPRSSSSGAIFTAPREFGGIDYQSGSASTFSAKGQASSLFRKSGNLMLRHSKSIPVLRRKPSGICTSHIMASDALVAGLPLGGLMAVSGGSNQDLGVAVSKKSPRLSLLPKSQSDWFEKFAATTTSSNRPQQTTGSITMSRAGSTPVQGAFATRHWTGRLEEGDVLGAILGLRQEQVWFSGSRTKVPADGSTKSRSASGPLVSDQSNPEHDNVGLPSSNSDSTNLASSPSTSSMASRVPIYGLSPFGTDVCLQDDPSSNLNGSSVRTDVPTFHAKVSLYDTSGQGIATEHVLPELDLGSTFTKSPRLHQLREAQSFDSSASDSTARDQPNPVDLDRYPAEMVPHLRAAQHSQTLEPDFFLFDVLQYYSRPSSTKNLSAIAGKSPRQRIGSDSLHRRFNSVDMIATSLSSHGVTGADDNTQRHFIAEAQALPTSAAPGDDPRFSLWAVRSEHHEGRFTVSDRDGEIDSVKTSSSTRNSFQPMASLTGSSSKKRGSRVLSPTGRANNQGLSRNSLSPTKSSAKSSTLTRDSLLFPLGKAALLAATVPRLIAELTSEIDHRLLADFFYTYREYLDPLQLLRLLILRFDWALAEPASAEDEARRRIVRVRTYVVIKYWLLHHFEYDFLPNRLLRQNLANWLNRVDKDERMAHRPADLGVIKSLRKVVRSLKETYSQLGAGGLLFNDPGRVGQNSTTHSIDPASVITSPKLEGSSIPETTEESDGKPSPDIGDDISLDFAADADDQQSVEGSPGADDKPAQGLGVRSPSGPHAGQKAAAESVVLATSRSSMIRSIRPVAPPSSSNYTTHSPPPPPLPHSHSTLSRVFAHTVGRLSRFKRVLGSRGGLLPGSADPYHEGLEFEANDSGDLLFIKGGLESFINYFNLGQPNTDVQSSESNSDVPTEGEEDDDEQGCQASDGTGLEETPSLSAASPNRSTPASSIDLNGPLPDSPIETGKTETGLGIHTLFQDVAFKMDDLENLTQLRDDSIGFDLGSLAPLEASKLMASRGPDHLHHTTSDQTLRSVSRMADSALGGTDIVRRPSSRSLNRRAPGSIRMSMHSARSSGPQIVQIDDIDLSSDEDDGAVRRALRRLPGARDLRMANHIRDLEPSRPSIDSLSSSFAFNRSIFESFHGHVRPTSIDSLAFLPPQKPIIGIVHSEMLDPDEALQGYELVKGFQLDGMESDDDEPGDVEAALRRLEGIIDEDKQRERTKKVETLWQNSLARNAEREKQEKLDHFDSQESQDADTRLSAIESTSLAQAEKKDGGIGSIVGEPTTDTDTNGVPVDAESILELDDRVTELPKQRRVSSSSQAAYDAQRSPAPSTKRATLTPSLESDKDAIPVGEPKTSVTSPQQQQSRLGRSNGPARKPPPPPPSGWTQTRFAQQSVNRALAASKLRLWDSAAPVHHSFLLAHRSEVITRQMTLIEAELLRAVNWDELAGSRWKERRFKSEVTDWEAFYRERVRDRLEAQKQNEPYQERAVEAIVARFNLTSNWVASEVVLTHHLDERVAVVSKFIRIAWKCYLQSNFASLAQIIFGLSTPWVERLRRTWSRVGFYEMRIWRDLNSFVGPKNNFRHLRNAMQSLAVNAGMDDYVGSTATAPLSGMPSSSVQDVASHGCIPFFGLFLSDLLINDALPSHLDPSSPSTTVQIDEEGNLASVANPSAFDHLARLPPGIRLQPLVNLYKYRVVSSTIKSVLAFQERSKAYRFEADANVYVKCLKIRCLQGEQLTQISQLIEP